MNQIISFDKEYAFLSNFYPCTVNAYKSAEAAYQAQKCENPQTGSGSPRWMLALPSGWGAWSTCVRAGMRCAWM